MVNKFNWVKVSVPIISCLALLYPFSGSAGFEDQHSIEVITQVLQQPISDNAEKTARDFDDKLLSEGQHGDVRIYLVTDERSVLVNKIVNRLLTAMNESSENWVVRVLDTEEPVVNAFVTGGKYIYVFSGLIKQAASEDELAFVLSHELGHSLLKHHERQKEDISTSIANIATLIGMLSKKKNRQYYNDFAKITVTTYGRVDEEEADAIGAAISQRAGYNSLRGADFFSRSKVEEEKAKRENQQLLENSKQEAQQSQLVCLQVRQRFNSSRQYQTQENANKVNSYCRDADVKRVTYSNLLLQNSTASYQDRSNSFYSTHPQDQNRIASLAALSDYFNHRRDLMSLSNFQQAYRVMTALNNVSSVLLQPATRISTQDVPDLDTGFRPNTTATSASLTAQLEDLKSAHDKGLITDAEYQQKRSKILNIQ